MNRDWRMIIVLERENILYQRAPGLYESRVADILHIYIIYIIHFVGLNFTHKMELQALVYVPQRTMLSDCLLF